jgi:cytidylate kinase
MAVITVSGEPGCRTREVAQRAAALLNCEHISGSRLQGLVEEEFGPADGLKPKSWPRVIASILVRNAAEMHMVVGVDGAEQLFPHFPALLRVRIVAPLNRRIGNTMLDDRLDRAAARASLRQQESAQRAVRKQRFGRARPSPDDFDLVLNAATLDPDTMARLVASASRESGILEMGYLSKAAEAALQFQYRYHLSKDGIQPRGTARISRAQFSHPSEEIFANLLDFYRIPWEYEPRTFPLQWDGEGKATEGFTPDFFLPESNLYVELTTMKQSLVTRKNRKIKRLRQFYPDVNIQVFYQKDLQDIVMKYGLSQQPAEG